MNKINKEELASLLRVDHAGEYGAKVIYEAQMKIIKDKKALKALNHMYETECQHLKFFEKELKTHGLKPSKLLPLWHIAGKTFGVITALLGKEAAMAATINVEEVIEKHYQEQIDILKDKKRA